MSLSIMEDSQKSKSKKIINEATRVVPEFVEGVLLANRNLMTIPGMNVLLRSDIEEVKQRYVTLISGGGSGHEPAHAGYVGQGLLSAAVLGNCFASPSVNSILSAIRVCAGPMGILLIVKNYTGDRLNFGMAAEKAKLEGIKVKMVIVADDCALQKGKGITGGRGIAGVVLVHKIAGAAAAAGLSLQQVYDEASAAAGAISTIGVALSTCTVPGCPPSTRLNGPIFELGMGIHGEPGREQRQLPDTNVADTIADMMVEALVVTLKDADTPLPAPAPAPASNASSSQPLVLMLNNLGSTPLIELFIVARGVMSAFAARGYHNIVRLFVGTFLTAFDMSGVSLSVMRVDEALLDRIDAPTTAPTWIAATVIDPEQTLVHRELPYDQDKYLSQQQIKGGFLCPYAKTAVRAVASRIVSIEPTLTQYDAVCGDGDCGIVMRAGAQEVLRRVGEGEETGAGGGVDSAELCDVLAGAVSASMGGTSGALLEIMLRAMASSLIDTQERASDWPSALSAGVQAVQTYGGASEGMRTMLDALIPAAAALSRGSSISDAAVAARNGAESTKTMEGLAGRSNYILKEQMRGIPDPGAVAVAEAFEAICAVLL